MFELASCIGRAIDSFAAQDFEDFEVLLIDDGSRDDTMDVCRRRCMGDRRFRLFSREHVGVASAGRNFGIREARGEYIVFCDGDDWIESGSLTQFAAALNRYESVDLLSARVSTVREEEAGRRIIAESSALTAADGLLSGPEALEKLWRTGRRLVGYSCLSIYRREFLLKHALMQREDIRLLEDHEWVARVFFEAERVAAIDFAYYNYLRREDSISTGLTVRSMRDVAAAVRALGGFLLTHEDGMSLAVRNFWAGHAFNVFFWYFFHPAYENCFAAEDRRRILRELWHDPASRREMRLLAKYASGPRRIAALLAETLRWGIVFPCRFYCQRLYFPLCDRRK